MFCRKCGKELGVGAQYCPNCGSRVSALPVVETKEEITPEIVEEKPFSLNENNNLNTVTIVLLISSVMLSVLSLFNFGLVVKIVCISLLFVIFVLSLLQYIFKRSKYDFFILALSISFVLFDAGMIVYLASI